MTDIHCLKTSPDLVLLVLVLTMHTHCFSVNSWLWHLSLNGSNWKGSPILTITVLVLQYYADIVCM